ncbi:hypothetical protein U1Q18_021409 [Sarracenia purpurea var. burkii]
MPLMSFRAVAMEKKEGKLLVEACIRVYFEVRLRTLGYEAAGDRSIGVELINGQDSSPDGGSLIIVHLEDEGVVPPWSLRRLEVVKILWFSWTLIQFSFIIIYSDFGIITFQICQIQLIHRLVRGAT